LRDARRAAGRPVHGWGATTAWLVDATAYGPELRAVHRLVKTSPQRQADGTPSIPDFVVPPWAEGVTALVRALETAEETAFGLVTADGAWWLRAGDIQSVRAIAAADAGPHLATL